MKSCVCILILFFSSTFIAQAQFISADDKLHFGAGLVISATTYTIVYATTKNKKSAFWYSFATATAAGLIKEIIDTNKVKNKFDTGELIATSLGGLTASTTINLFVGNKKKRNIALVN